MHKFTVKERREALGLDPKTVATELGLMTKCYISKEEGETCWTAVDLVKLKKALKTTIAELTI